MYRSFSLLLRSKDTARERTESLWRQKPNVLNAINSVQWTNRYKWQRFMLRVCCGNCQFFSLQMFSGGAYLTHKVKIGSQCCSDTESDIGFYADTKDFQRVPKPKPKPIPSIIFVLPFQTSQNQAVQFTQFITHNVLCAIGFGIFL